MPIVHSIEAADLLTPVSAYLRLSRLSDDPYRMLLESVEGGAARGRYSVIALLPDLVWKCRNGEVTLDGTPLQGKPLETLKDIIDQSQMDLPVDMPPMIGGVFGVLGYDMVRQMEFLPNAPVNDVDLPEGIMIRPQLFAVFDSVRDELTLAVPVRGAMTTAEAHALLDRARAALAAPLEDATETLPAGTELAPPSSNMTQEQFEANVRTAQDYIAAGDAFQIVPSQRFTTPFPLSPLALYRSLRRINPAPFLFLMELEDYALVGSSPEILVRLRAGEVTVRPLAGTRPRGNDRAHDLELEKELLADQKELAEHLMLIDLGRNDVGRVSELGTVQVPDQFVIERYSHVMHISSTVTGQIKAGKTAMDALVAAFPAGTLTGAPKIRAMEIIDELEPTRRGPYSGCVGYFGADGEMDTCIGLRMAVLKNGQMYVQAGCGVVADSDPNSEFRETQAKARALFRAAEVAVSNAAKS
ncbi:anthranilate synthase component I [Gluconobacter frateurii]|uniref:Anthranilate synthase component 1 n=1 Tax=Gluconobacter frateurii NRIC 0228 TaxID=1307946 RepID=A0ABQ0QEJ6_9PROT|nr:anthranilate synthase component I [Gluconobacter frateurii]GBR15836.1 anthranilate synthase component I [Gluconobacter frateurii NRIC 0228]GLP90413.1 anthranilate synthase component 1 [Gluconobacter frateurii]